MPFYEYQCGACGQHHEALQKVSDPPLRKCPACGKSRLSKMMSAPVFRLKGSGWYETDFKSDQENKRNLAVDKEDKPEKAEPAKADAAADKAGESKPGDSKAEAAKPDMSKPAPEKPAAGKSEKTASKSASKSTAARPKNTKSRVAKSRRKTRR